MLWRSERHGESLRVELPTRFAQCPEFFANGLPPQVPHQLALRKLCYEAFAVLHSGTTRTPVFVAGTLSRALEFNGTGGGVHPIAYGHNTETVGHDGPKYAARIGARQSMDGKGCRRDNVFVERLWRSVKANWLTAGAHL